MPRRRRIPKRRLDRLNERQRQLLLLGVALFEDEPGFESEQEEREAWERHREALLAECAAERPARWRPAAWWKYEAPEPRNKDEPEAEQLARLGLLTPEERALLR